MTVTTLIEGDAEILDVRSVDLSRWRGPPLATVYSAGDSWPGSPDGLAGFPSTRLSYGGGGLDPRGLAPEDVHRFRELDVSLTPAVFRETEGGLRGLLLGAPSGARDGGSRGLALDSAQPASADVAIERRPDGLFVRTPAPRYAYAILFPPLVAREGGRYFLRATCRIEEGGFQVGALSADQGRWLAVGGKEIRLADGAVRRIAVLDLEAGAAVVPAVTNSSPEGDRPSTFLVESVEVVLQKSE